MATPLPMPLAGALPALHAGVTHGAARTLAPATSPRQRWK